jgi:carbonic anhydrase
MESLDNLLENNREWAERMFAEDPGYFQRLINQQSPEYLWIGCSDSRVPANQITGLRPGEVFVHRNVANVVVQTDFNMLSVVQYAVEVLKVRHIIVCGHYGCGGVKAAMEETQHGLIDNWLRHIQSIARRNAAELDALGEVERGDRMCELNVIGQAENLARTTVVQDAWRRGQQLHLHSWIYRLHDGRLRVLADPMAGEQLDFSPR